MSIYNQRDKPAYGNFKTHPSYAKNQHILKWWNQTLDELLTTQISEWQWVWYWTITDEIVKITPSSTLDAWKKSDPLCKQYAWYNILMYFAAARAEQLGLTKAIRIPKNKTCPLCNEGFIESSLPMPLIKTLGIDRLNYCAPCLSDTVLPGAGSDSNSKQEIIEYLQDLASIIERVPDQAFGNGLPVLIDLTDKERLALLKVLKRKPNTNRVKFVFGSWLNALIQAKLLEDGTRKTSRGIQSLAKDGHVCLSLGEKTIDDFLYSHGILHEKEPRYPEGNMRGDFKVGATIIEYFGLTGNPDYDAKTKKKIRLCKKHNINLIAIYPKDLISQKRLENKLLILTTESLHE